MKGGGDGGKTMMGRAGDERAVSTQRPTSACGRYRQFHGHAVWRSSRAREGMSMHTRRSTLASGLLLVVGLRLLFLCTEARADGACRRKIKVPLTDFGNFSPPVQGKATLCINDTGPGAGVSGSIEASELQPGNAYTVWFLYWDDPSQCETPGM